MLEGLPPNNAAHVMRVTLDEARARAVADLMVESFEPAEAASTAFETETPWPGGGKAWAVEVYFGFEPDEDGLRELVAAAAGDEAAALVEFGLTEKQDWVANSLAGLKPVRAGRFLVHGAHDRDKVGPSDIGIEIEAGLAFGTGHHGTTRGCLLHFDRLLKRRRPRHVLDVGCGAGVLAIAAARALQAQGLARRHRPRRGRGRQRQRRAQRRRRPGPRRSSRAGVENRRAARGRALRSRVRQHPRQAAAAAGAVAGAGDGAATARRSSRGCCSPTCPACLSAWGAQGFD